MVTLAPENGVFGISIILSLMAALLLHRQMYRLTHKRVKSSYIIFILNNSPDQKLGPDGVKL